jgi:hypothetical protein
MATTSSTGVKLPTVKVAQRFDVVPRSIERWAADAKLAFPKPLIIRKRKYWELSELETWERSRAARS